jgi:hypothetical protein
VTHVTLFANHTYNGEKMIIQSEVHHKRNNNFFAQGRCNE